MVSSGGSGATGRPRILIVDDEPNIRTALVRLFRLEGFDAGEAVSGSDALDMLRAEAYELMIVDLNLPGIDGTEVMRQARLLDPDLRMIVLTGHPSLDSAIAAVRLNAVDYLQKPASLTNIARVAKVALLSRAEELRRRELLRVIGDAVEVLRKSEAPAMAEAGEPSTGDRAIPHLTLQSERRQLVLPGNPNHVIELTEGEMGVLEVLMSRPDQAFSCRQIVQLAWHYDVEEWEAQSMVRPHIFRLRRKIEIDPDNPRCIKTLRGRGYLFSLAC